MLDNESNESIARFALSYTTDRRNAISFAWNGKHGAEFRDDNWEFRSSVARLILSEPDSVPIVLVRDVLMEDVSWSREAWSAPHHFAGLMSILLQRGGKEYLVDFAVAMNNSFDTFGAAHGVTIPHQLAHELIQETGMHLLIETDARRRIELESAAELFHKLIAGNATDGWVIVPPGTPVRNIRVVAPAAPGDTTIRTFRGWLNRLLRRL